MKTARMFKFRIRPGMEQAYADYLRDVVTPIDAVAHKADVFRELVTVMPDGETSWNHGRLFIFRDAAQRDAFAAGMADAAAAFDGSEAAKVKRKAYAETLRKQVAVSDYTLS
ncbi:MAG TPA: hypothetical protein VGC16_07895 [Rhizomicrobium sp.]